jgi:predicted PurR-regulated permease PerM
MVEAPDVARNRVQSDFYKRVFALVVALVLGFTLYRIVRPFAGPIAWAMLFAFLLFPLHVRLTRRLRGRQELSALILTIGGMLLLIGPVTGLGLGFAEQAGELVTKVEALARSPGETAARIGNAPVVDRALDWLDEAWGVTTKELQTWAVGGAERLLRTMASVGSKLVLGAVGTIVGFGLMMFLLYFFLRDGAAMLRTGEQLIPMPADRTTRLAEYLSSVTRAVVFGTGLTALIQGALVGIAFALVGLPAPLVFGAVAVLFAMLPVGGTALVWVPAAGILALQNRWGAATFVLVWGALLVGTIDNLLRPLLISGRARVSTLTVFIGVLGGVAAFGAIGLFLGPVVLALITATIRFMIEVEDDEPPPARTG